MLDLVLYPFSKQSISYFILIFKFIYLRHNCYVTSVNLELQSKFYLWWMWLKDVSSIKIYILHTLISDILKCHKVSNRVKLEVPSEDEKSEWDWKCVAGKKSLCSLGHNEMETDLSVTSCYHRALEYNYSCRDTSHTQSFCPFHTHLEATTQTK